MNAEVHYRPLEHQDKPQLKVGIPHRILKAPYICLCEQLAHYDLFPVDYEDKFFEMACQGGTNIYSVAAFHLDSDNSPTKLIGFIIGRSVLVSDIDPTVNHFSMVVGLVGVSVKDRNRIGIVGRMWNSLHATYVLTIGVVKEFQQQGIATELLKQFESEAEKRGSKLLYLHVITYNESAIQFYRKCNYECAALARDFYLIRSGRQQDPNRSRWDAFLFVKHLDLDDEMLQMLTQAKLNEECVSWSPCWPFNTKLWFSQWSSERDNTVSMADHSSKIGFSESSSLLYRLFNRRSR